MSDEAVNEQGREDLDSAVAYLGDLLKRMALEVSVDGQLDGHFIRINVSGEHAGELVGGNGAAAQSQLLDALQLLASRSLRSDSNRSIVIDAAGFRDARLTALEGAATSLAGLAIEAKQTVRVHGMNSFDRRAIHLALKEDSRVNTDSEGDGVFRMLTVVAAKSPEATESSDD